MSTGEQDRQAYESVACCPSARRTGVRSRGAARDRGALTLGNVQQYLEDRGVAKFTWLERSSLSMPSRVPRSERCTR